MNNIKNDQKQNQNVTLLSKYLVDIIQQIAIKFNKVIKKVKDQIVDPINMFIQNQQITNELIIKRSQQNIQKIQSNNEYLKQFTNNYQISLKQSSYLFSYKDQYQQIYHLQIQKSNERLLQLKRTYIKQILPQIDRYNITRINFTIKKQLQTINLFNQILNEENLNHLLKDYQYLNLYHHNQSQNQNYISSQKEKPTITIEIKDQMRQKIGKLTLLQQNSLSNQQQFQLLKVKSNQTIHNISNNMDKIKDNDKINIQKRLIDDFIAIFTTKAYFKKSREYNNFQYQHARNLILGHSQYLLYFLHRFKLNLQTQVNLSIVKYHQLTAIIKYIFAQATQIQTQKQSIIYLLLFIAYRIKYNNQQYLMKELGKKNQFWREKQIWLNLIVYLKKSKETNKKSIDNKIKQQKNFRQKQKQKQKQKIKQKYQQGILHKPLNYLRYGTKLIDRDFWLRKTQINNTQHITKQKQKSQRMSTDAEDYEIICELNYFMIKLQLQQKFVFDFFLQVRQRFQLSSQNIGKLIKSHYFSRLTTNNKVGSLQIKRKKRLQKKYNSLNTKQQKLCWAIGKCLKYLQIGKFQSNITRLLLVNKHFADNLCYRIYQRYLIYQNNLSNRQRFVIYCQICKPAYTQKVYYKMVKQMPQITDHTQIIYLDAKRSLSWNEGLRINLMEILGVYAFYYPQVGYLQGMNYLSENILKLSNDNYKVYSIFQFIMNMHYQNMYTGKFDGLKIKIYQVMRILQLINPKLSLHLTNQKIQGQHFLLSWAITLWGQMSGQLSWILWDGFLIKGWKWFIKTCLWLLKNLQGFLFNMNFQQIMKCFGELSGSILSLTGNQFSLYAIDKQKIKLQINNIRVESQILKDLQKQYQTKINSINQYLKKIQNQPK